MKATLDFETQLHSIPLRNKKVRVFPSDDNPEILIAEVNLRYMGPLKMARMLLKLRDTRRFKIEGLTRELYERLDGKCTVEELVNEIAASEQLTFFEARAFIVQYLKGLMERGLIVIVSDDEEHDEA